MQRMHECPALHPQLELSGTLQRLSKAVSDLLRDGHPVAQAIADDLAYFLLDDLRPPRSLKRVCKKHTRSLSLWSKAIGVRSTKHKPDELYGALRAVTEGKDFERLAVDMLGIVVKVS